VTALGPIVSWENYLLDRLPFSRQRWCNGLWRSWRNCFAFRQLGGDLELGGILGDASLFDVNTGEA